MSYDKCSQTDIAGLDVPFQKPPTMQDVGCQHSSNNTLDVQVTDSIPTVSDYASFMENMTKTMFQFLSNSDWSTPGNKSARS